MNFLIVKDGIITNIIVADKQFANKIGALPYYDGAEIGKEYQPEPTELEKLRADIDYLSIMTGVTL